MEYIYTVLLLHELKKDINEENIKKVVSSVGVEPDDVRVKAVVAAMSEVNIDEVLKSGLAPMMAQPVPQPPPAPAEEKKPEEKKAEKKEEKKAEEETLAGLSSLFG